MKFDVLECPSLLITSISYRVHNIFLLYRNLFTTLFDVTLHEFTRYWDNSWRPCHYGMLLFGLACRPI
jgi:hypothetical protein